MKKRISKKKLYDLLSATLLRAVQILPMDVKKAIEKTLGSETHPIARLHLETFLKNAELGEERGTFVCPDTGWVIFYVKIGDGVELEGGLSSLHVVAKKVVARLSARGKLRPTLADPVTRKNIDSNVGDKFPKVEILPSSSIRTLEVTAIPKGGGSEISGTFFRMLLPADGMNGVIRFVIDSFLASSYAGKTCPPNIIGVGIGGTADVCMEMAKKAAVLRVVGDRHPDPQIAKLELDLLSALNELMVGPMGMGGKKGVLDVHIEKGLVHTGALPVAFNAQCCLCRRATGRLNARGEVVFVDNPKWRD
jgi:tartrate/fumarate subfamily iron-sulfur-dependent hydro-lyase alpha chain